jgi:hypothetical protein
MCDSIELMPVDLITVNGVTTPLTATFPIDKQLAGRRLHA